MTRALVGRGMEVVGVDIVEGLDARDFFRLDDTRFDLVVHLAAVIGGRQKIDGAPLDLAVDLAIDAEMFTWALRTKQRRIVYYSSAAAYPINLQWLPLRYRLREDDIDLNDIATPDMTYGWAKLTGEMLASHAMNAGVPVSVIRPFSGYGEDQALDYPFPTFIQRARARQTPFKVWGDGQQVRDFIHIDDVVDATLAAVDLDVQGPINLGWGRPTSFNELACLVTGRTSTDLTIEHILDAPRGVEYRVADNSKMLTFYEPKITLEEGIRRALQ